VPRLRSIDRLVSRHRRLTALAGLMIVLGVAALNVHAALPEHHGGQGDASVCEAALSIAVLAVLGWRARRAGPTVTRPFFVPILQVAGRMSTECPPAAARAGPPGPSVLRL
jgi:hypothetical protein